MQGERERVSGVWGSSNWKLTTNHLVSDTDREEQGIKRHVECLPPYL